MLEHKTWHIEHMKIIIVSKIIKINFKNCKFLCIFRNLEKNYQNCKNVKATISLCSLESL